ncbi:MAG: DoxX family protein [Solirubrobacteraceae bacterium]|jgi:putative oxidoreductase
MTTRDRLTVLLSSGPRDGPAAAAALVVRLAAGAVFLAFGVVKFTRHASEVASFQAYGLPVPEAFVYVIGVIELAGGAMLIAGLATRVAALVMAGDMVGAIVVSGIGLGEPVSLTLAPALLILMVALLWVGPGCLALDRVVFNGSRRAPPRRPATPA